MRRGCKYGSSTAVSICKKPFGLTLKTKVRRNQVDKDQKSHDTLQATPMRALCIHTHTHTSVIHDLACLLRAEEFLAVVRLLKSFICKRNGKLIKALLL